MLEGFQKFRRGEEAHGFRHCYASYARCAVSECGVSISEALTATRGAFLSFGSRLNSRFPLLFLE